MSTHLLESAHTSSAVRHGKFAYPLQAVQLKEARCLGASRKEHVDDSAYIDVEGHQVRRYVSADGRLYFGYKQFLSPSILANSVVFSAFLVAVKELSQFFAGQNTHSDRFEAVIVLQCVSLTEPQFSYYFIDHYLRRASDESILKDDQIDNRGTVRWNVAAYWDHVATFSAHRLCTAKDYEQVLQGLKSQAPSLDAGNSGAPSILETLRSLLAGFDHTSIDAHTTVSVARVMKYASGPSPAPNPPSATLLRSTILRSFSGILLSGDAHNLEDDVHPTVHEDAFGMPALTEPSAQDREEGTRPRIGWRGGQE